MENDQETTIIENLQQITEVYKNATLIRVTAAALSAIPWVGSLISAAATYSAEKEQGKKNVLYENWLNVHKQKLNNLAIDIKLLTEQVNQTNQNINDKFNSPEFLELTHRAFKIWDDADTREKQHRIINLLANSCSTNLCDEDTLRLFINWIKDYDESYFKVIAIIYRNKQITRGNIWRELGNNKQPNENSATADLFKNLIRGLTLGGLIRQHRETDWNGNFIKKVSSKSTRSKQYVSAFDDNEEYELTDMGQQFVHYAMNEVVTRITT